MQWRSINAELAGNFQGSMDLVLSVIEHVSSFPSVHRCSVLSLSGQRWISGFSRVWQVARKGPRVSVVGNIAVLVALYVCMLEKWISRRG